ncbi:MAG: hypothetical protein AB1578_10130 [Thermodesulfobacteriota bacterium]|jgi:hypothetical protein
MAKRMEDWDAGQFYAAFHGAAEKAADAKFREKFEALAKAIEPLQREFARQTAKCGPEIGSLMEDLQWIAAKMGYCEKPRGFERECEDLYRRLCQAIAKVNSLRDTCFV